MPDDKSIVVLDVGTSKICCLIAQYNVETGIEIIGKGQSPSHGIKMGVVTDLEECAKSIEIAVLDAENSAGIAGMHVHNVFAGISGEHIATGTNLGKIEITNKNHKITQSDVDNVIRTAGGVELPRDRQIIHVIPRGYRIDGYNGVTNPVGMCGSSLEVDAYLVTGINMYLQTIASALEMTELTLEKDGYILSTIAAGEVVLRKEEKDLGILLLDMGAGTTKIVAYKGGSLISCRTLPIGGDKITRDIALIFKIPLSEAEGLKVSKGAAYPEFLTGDEESEVMEAISFSESEAVNVQRKMLAEIIEARLVQIFEEIRHEIKLLNDKGIYLAGAILTGGTARLKDINHLASNILQLRTRVGKPTHIPGLNEWEGNPEFAGVVGTLKMAAEKRKDQGDNNVKNPVLTVISDIWEWIKQAC